MENWDRASVCMVQKKNTERESKRYARVKPQFRLNNLLSIWILRPFRFQTRPMESIVIYNIILLFGKWTITLSLGH